MGAPLGSVMKKLRFFLPIQLVLGLLITVPSLATTQLDVTGKGMVSVTPDEATITAQVSSVDQYADKAHARASKEVDAMLSAIKSFSLKPDSLNATELSYSLSTDGIEQLISNNLSASESLEPSHSLSPK